jgi:hypothetical protein
MIVLIKVREQEMLIHADLYIGQEKHALPEINYIDLVTKLNY